MIRAAPLLDSARGVECPVPLGPGTRHLSSSVDDGPLIGQLLEAARHEGAFALEGCFRATLHKVRSRTRARPQRRRRAVCQLLI